MVHEEKWTAVSLRDGKQNLGCDWGRKEQTFFQEKSEWKKSLYSMYNVSNKIVMLCKIISYITNLLHVPSYSHKHLWCNFILRVGGMKCSDHHI